MKDSIQPELKDSTITCVCGAEFKLKSVNGDMRVEICSNCHPFYTGKTKRAAVGGRVERFKKKYGMKDDDNE